MNKSFKTMIKVFFLETFKNKIEVFFTLFFPVLFLVIFGFLFTQNNIVKTYTYGISGTINDDVKNYFKPNKILIYENEEKLKEAVNNNKVDYGIYMNNNEVKYYYVSNMNSNIQWIKYGANSGVKKYLLKLKKDYISVDEKLIKLGKTQTNPMEYLLTGIIAISILSGGMFSVINVFGRYKKLGIIKRFMVAPVKPYQFVISASFNKLILNFASIFFIIILGKMWFNLSFQFNWFLLIIVGLSTTIGMMGVGILILVLFKETESANTASSILFTIMMFFAGIYFPISFIPGYLRWLSYILPVKYVVDIIRYVAGVESMNILVFWFINIIFILSGTLLLIIASKNFVKESK
ncbi:transport permease protein [Tepiditoga spiralis]|uniref:Transport permease protein n=1 Tax=Tepiditoga spiralis TaxID=2108365 RepID=A0A7G1G1A5_9BACT|nr:ABC transporter permease [Tepiditoga spiralis]BBE29920.1 transport permease protein [Tepiditoga spiralis]